MRTITNGFKTELKAMGKEIDAKITYTINGTSYTLGADDLNSVKPHYQSGILKSTMKELEIDSNIDIPLGTIIECQFGIKVNGSFEYITYGHYIVYSSEKQEDLYSYKITCYDKMLYSMKDYEAFATYPITIRDYINALCTQIGLTFKNANDYFTNYDKIIEKELYLDDSGNSLNYTFRDVLDELAQVTASTICINENDDELEIRYITNAGETTTNVSGTNLSITSEDSQVNNIQLLGNTTQNGTPTPSSPQEVVNVTGRQEVKCVGTNLIGLDTQQYKVNLSAGDKITLRNTGSSSLQLNLYTNYGDSTRNDYWSVSSGSTRTITLAYNTKAIAWNINVSSNGVAWVNKGESILDYEPYKEETNEVNLGKNLFDKSSTPLYYAQSMQYTETDTGCKLTTGASGSGFVLIDLGDIKNFENKTLTFSMSNTANTLYKYIAFIGCDNAGGNRTTIGSALGSSSNVLTTTIGSGYTQTRLTIRLYIDGGTANTDYELNNIQLEIGSTATTYSEYFTPIELCKIGTYQDKIFKNSGKNLAPTGQSFSGSTNQWYDQFGNAMGTLENIQANNNYIDLKPNTTYSLFLQEYSNISTLQVIYINSSNSIATYVNTTSLTSTITFTTTTYTRIYIRAKATGNSTNTYFISQLEKGSSSTEYEPYGSGEWYKKEVIGKLILDGNSNIIDGNVGSAFGNTYRYYTNFDNIKINSTNSIDLYSNYFKGNIYVFGSANATEGMIGSYRDTTRVYFTINQNSVANCKTWLSTHNTIVYYVLATPTYTKLNDTLQEQLNSIRLLEGLNNITTNVPIDLTYVSGIDTIDEEYFNEDNVNFGEMYGPVNTIILSRSAESDEIAQSIPSNLSDDEKVAIKIKENQIMNFDNRDEFLYGILTRLYGLRYTQNDYSSKGICYYNVCDRYKANIFGKDYYCVMLNDDVTIESGLSENVFTELPETAQTDYSKTSTSDRIERQTTLIVDKQAGEIRGLVSGLDNEINGDNGIESRLSTAETTLTNHSATLTFIEENTINEDGSVKALKTSTDYTFDSEGLKIGKSTDDYNSLQDNTGTYYYEKDTMIGKYTKDGSVQKDLALYGKYYYGIDEEGDFNVNTFERSDALFLAQLYEKDSEQGFGHFWNGE